jgi:hypothetical protein
VWRRVAGSTAAELKVEFRCTDNSGEQYLDDAWVPDTNGMVLWLRTEADGGPAVLAALHADQRLADLAHAAGMVEDCPPDILADRLDDLERYADSEWVRREFCELATPG